MSVLSIGRVHLIPQASERLTSLTRPVCISYSRNTSVESYIAIIAFILRNIVSCTIDIAASSQGNQKIIAVTNINPP